MNDHTAIATALQQITSLSSEEWDLVNAETAKAVRALEPEPEWDAYASTVVGRFPEYVNKGMLILLTIIALGAFWVSAGKQVAAIESVLHSVVNSSGGRVSQLWLDVALLAALLAGELSALACSACAAIFAHRGSKTVWTFRVLALLCAGTAIGGNVALTMLYPDEHAAWFQWFITLLMPCLVLIVGFVGEMFLLDSLEHRYRATLKFEEDRANWKLTQRDPSEHDLWNEMRRARTWDAVYARQSPSRQKLMRGFREAMPEFALLVVEREERRHQIFSDLRADLRGEGDANFSQPSSEGVSLINS